MSTTAFASNRPAPAAGPTAAGPYEPGVCNIGPAEIARRRYVGHVGVVATLVVLGALLAVGAPPPARLLLVLPAGVAAAGYLQAALGFCAGFGARGVFNFGDLGPTTIVDDPAARRLDRYRSLQINAASLLVGVIVAIVAVLLPV